MKAWQASAFGEPHAMLRQHDVERPAPGDSQLLVKVEAAGLNLFDDLIIRGKYQSKPQLPFVPGSEIVGRVVERGPGARTEPGARVAGLTADGCGALAEYAVLDDAAALAVPPEMDPADTIALLVNFQTAHLALIGRAGLRHDEILLVHGAGGGVGVAAVQLGVAAGARVIATVRGAAQTGAVRSLGAELVLDTADPAERDFVAAVNETTCGAGANVACDMVGGEVFERTPRALAWGGRLLVVGFASGSIGQIAANECVLRNISIIGVNFGGSIRRDPHLLRETHTRLVELYEQGRLRPVHQPSTFEEVPDALATIRSGRTVGKVVVRF